jgi:microcystin-dependent protein
MATVTASYNWVSGETVTPAKLNTTAAPTVVVDDAEITNAKLASGIDASKLTTGTLPIARVEDGAVTQAKLASGVGTPAGAVMPFAMNSAPAGWLAANGTAVSRSTYAALFSAISTTYGAGDGSTTFALPDLRGYFVRGSGTNGDATASGTFGVKQADDLKSHTHSYTDQVRVSVGVFNVAGGTGQDGATDLGRTTGSTGGTETRPKNIAMLYCIKF